MAGFQVSLEVLLQPLIFYSTAALTKLRDPDWRAGRGLEFALEDPFDTRNSALWLLEFPELTKVLTWLTIVVQLLAPMLALLGKPRGRLLAIGALAAFQIGVWSAMSIGTLPIVALLLTLPLLPGDCWPRAIPSVSSRPAPLYVEAIFVIVFVLAVVSASSVPLQVKSPLPSILRRTGLAQHWGMFAHPRGLPRGSFAIVAESPGRSPVNFLTGDAMTDARIANVADLLPFRERRLWTTYTAHPELEAPPETLRWLCRSVAGVFHGVERVTVYFGDTGHPRDAGDPTGVEWQRISTAECR
jgi:hypothetical protein